MYTELDFYKISIDIHGARSKKDDLIGAEEIPIPNVIIYSGRGLRLVWLIDRMVYTEKYIKLWSRMQKVIYERLQCLHADNAARSGLQIFRLPGSVHSITNTVVKAECLKEMRYTITELKDSLLDELPEDWRKQGQSEKKLGIEKEKKTGKRKDKD
ncbi:MULTISPECIES: hypothetical protein [unclassified Lysinibacillus]|uniref:hypothetical protein n=1 Tax=unclassified Lysinibacillus TaxID=2636778 RepID=UPI0037F77326